MSSRARVALIGPLAAALASLALADTEPSGQTRATIRGTGKDITIVYVGVKNPPAARAGTAARGDAMAEATRLAAGGADDDSLIAYFRTHQVELPPIVSAEAVERLRQAGAGAAVITDLSRMTALDIGETGEGSPVTYTSEAVQQGYDFPSADAGYPYYGYGMYGGYGFSGFRHPSHHGGSFRPGHSGMRPGRPGGSPSAHAVSVPQRPRRRGQVPPLAFSAFS